MTRQSLSLRDSLVRAASTIRTAAAWPVRDGTGSGRRHHVAASAESHGGASQGPGARSPKLARVEAVLFAAGEPLSTRRIADAANLADGAEARVLVQELKTLYEADGSAFTVQGIAGGWYLCTKPEYAASLEKMHPNRHPPRLSQPAVETLAVVAYRQPILRADVESIRGVACGEMLRQLIERGLVRIVGHHDSLGRPLLYGTTRKFLEVFGLADLADLPIAEQLRKPAHTRVESAPAAAELGEPSEHLAPAGTEADQ